ncbi:hypothetical protein GCM10008097_08370 [Mycetocola manganoxydans]|nr:hypothetical protein GCM10008097_08370 [Mycetocola manganoxydans]
MSFDTGSFGDLGGSAQGDVEGIGGGIVEGIAGSVRHSPILFSGALSGGVFVEPRRSIRCAIPLDPTRESAGGGEAGVLARVFRAATMEQ